MLGNDIPWEVDGVAVDLTFLQFEIHMVFREFLEDLRHVMAMFSQVPGVNEDVVDVDNDKSVEEYLIHECLEHGG